ncbi:pseudouridine synthase [Shewanella waksmanii]|uniref:pseudouridine synthase n=1 Tax=Shewanella waksmanii TaxID=213783 RepID=UPI0004B938D5|nr:pseudouridine synthase [Shewanella waksmanii]
MSVAHFRCFKPYGTLSQFVPEQRKRKPLLADLGSFPQGIMAIGRLDHDSEGLILLTTDGKMSHYVRSKNVEKEYYVEVDGLITQAAIQQLGQGVRITHKGQPHQTLPCQVKRLDSVPDLPDRGRKIRDARHGPTSWVSIVINEGKHRQVRKMTAAVGFATLRLVRVRVGHIQLGDMQVGEVLPFSEADMQPFVQS